MATLFNPKSNPMLRWNDFKPKPLPQDKVIHHSETYVTPGATLKSTDRATYVEQVLKKYETHQDIYDYTSSDYGIRTGTRVVYNLGKTGYWDVETTNYGDRAAAENKYRAEIDKLFNDAVAFNKLHTHTREWTEVKYADQASVIAENARNEANHKQGVINEWKQFQAMQTSRSQAGRGERLYWSEEFDQQGKRVQGAPAAKPPAQQGTYTGAPKDNEDFIDPASASQVNSLLSSDSTVTPILTNNKQQRKRQQLLAS